MCNPDGLKLPLIAFLKDYSPLAPATIRPAQSARPADP